MAGCRVHHCRTARGGFTLIESMMATAILLLIVTAVTSAVVAGQQHAFEARQRIAASLAAEELMGRLDTAAYADLPTWDGYGEAVGSMLAADGKSYPPNYATIGRDVSVWAATERLSTFNIAVTGRRIRVRTFDTAGRELSRLVRFVPEPAP